jgi:hypothetical protein
LQAGALDRRYSAVAVIDALFGSRPHMRDDLGHEGWIEQMRTLEEGWFADHEAGLPLAYQTFALSSAPEGEALWQGDEPYNFYTSRLPGDRSGFGLGQRADAGIPARSPYTAAARSPCC